MGKDINDRVIGENEPLEFIKEEPKKKPKVITYEGVMAKRCASAVAMAALSVAIIVTAFVTESQKFSDKNYIIKPYNYARCYY